MKRGCDVVPNIIDLYACTKQIIKTFDKINLRKLSLYDFIYFIFLILVNKS